MNSNLLGFALTSVLLLIILKTLKNMANELDDLSAKVVNNGTVIGSAITLLQNIKSRLDSAGTDPAKLKQLSDDLGSQDQQLADAIVANTPAEEEPPTEPPVEPTAKRG